MSMKATLAGCAVIAALALGLLAAPQADAASYGNCYYYNKTQYGVTCDIWVGDHSTRLGIRYGYYPGANTVSVTRGWLDGSNNGWDWVGPMGSGQNRFRFNFWRACSEHWATGYVCTPWLS